MGYLKFLQRTSRPGPGFLLLISILRLFVFPQLGWAQRNVIRSVWVHQVPKPPQGDFWDPAVLNIFNFRGVYPDIVVCASSSIFPRVCTQVCPDAQLEPGSRECILPLGGQGLPFDLRNPAIQVKAYEFDPGRQRPMAAFNVKDATACSDEAPCSFDTPKGPFVISFELAGRILASPQLQPGNRQESTRQPIPPKPPSPCVSPPEPAGPAGEVPTNWKSLDGRPFILGAGDQFQPVGSWVKSCCIHYNDVTQGLSGNCFLLSALAAISVSSPGSIKKMIKPLGNGSYEITFQFPAGNNQVVPKAVTVTSSFPAFSWYSWQRWSGGSGNPASPSKWSHPFIYAQPGDLDESGSELWPMLIEKAYANTHDGYQGFATGGESGSVMQLITGKPSESYLVSPNPQPDGLDPNYASPPSCISTKKQLDEKLTTLWREGYAITVGTIPLCPPPEEKSYLDRLLAFFNSGTTQASKPAMVDSCGKPNQEFRCTAKEDPFFQEANGLLVRSHAYFVINYLNGWVTLGNPWGGGVQLDLDQFMHSIRGIQANKPDVNPDCGCE